MKNTVALIDKLIAEHRAIIKGARSLEQTANDAGAIEELAEARETFVPGRFDQKQTLQQLQELLEKTDDGLKGHFQREETALLAAFEEQGDKKLVSALNSLLIEHQDLLSRMQHSKEHVDTLINGGLGRHQWEASANDMRAHLSHTRKLLEAHAAIENELFTELRRHLKGK